jgi:hypothetical protein
VVHIEHFATTPDEISETTLMSKFKTSASISLRYEYLVQYVVLELHSPSTEDILESARRSLSRHSSTTSLTEEPKPLPKEPKPLESKPKQVKSELNPEQTAQVQYLI